MFSPVYSFFKGLILRYYPESQLCILQNLLGLFYKKLRLILSKENNVIYY